MPVRWRPRSTSTSRPTTSGRTRSGRRSPGTSASTGTKTSSGAGRSAIRRGTTSSRTAASPATPRWRRPRKAGGCWTRSASACRISPGSSARSSITPATAGRRGRPQCRRGRRCQEGAPGNRSAVRDVWGMYHHIPMAGRERGLLGRRGTGGTATRRECMSDFREAWSLERALVRGRLSRRDFIRRSAALGLSAPTIAAVLAACGASPTPTSVPAAPTTAPTAVGATAAPTRAAGGASPAATAGAARGASPAATSAATTPALAERWETPDDTTYIFHLRQGVKWHDGTDFTAEDVKYTFDIVIDPKGPAGWRANFDAVSAIDIVDKYTVKFTTKTPFPPLLGAFAILRSSAIIPKGAMERKKLDTEVVGTGPYKLAEYVPKSHIRLVKHKDYWDKYLPYIDEVTFKILEDEDARIAGLRGGSLDYALLSPEGQQRLQNEKSIVITSNPRIYNYIVSFNPRRKPWFDPKVRQAVNLAIDRQEISDKVFSGGLTPGGPIPPGFGNWPIPNEELTSKWYKQDVERAKQLLKEAGVQQGQELNFVVTAFR